MPSIWLIGVAFPAALGLAVAFAYARRHPQRRAIVVGATAAGLFWLIGWSVARAFVDADASHAFEAIFLQLALCTISSFVFAVVAMLAARFG